MYWLVVIVGFLALGYNEKHGHWPLMKNKNKGLKDVAVRHGSDSSTATPVEKSREPSSKVREVDV